LDGDRWAIRTAALSLRAKANYKPLKTYTIPVIPGDGIGPEVIAEGRKVLEAAAAAHGFAIQWREFPLGADHYLKTGELVSAESFAELTRYPAIYFGAVGDERVPPGILEKGIILALRYHFDQYVNLRPARVFAGVEPPLRIKPATSVDFVIVRENTEDFYIDVGGRAGQGKTSSALSVHRALYDLRMSIEIESTSEQVGYQFGLASREGVRRILRYGFTLARRRRKRLALADKANVLTNIYGLWREEFRAIAAEFPDVSAESYYVDALSALLVSQPQYYDVIVTPNLFGDILSDLAAGISGSMGLAPGANLNPEGTSLFEPVHGSAPTIAGLHRANPIAAIWAGAMMLEFLGETTASEAILRAMGQHLREEKVRTPDLGGSSRTQDVGDDIVSRL
jgi:tartrate dehydrogenase/decarboxylase / D-malate dehydrogenase